MCVDQQVHAIECTPCHELFRHKTTGDLVAKNLGSRDSYQPMYEDQKALLSECISYHEWDQNNSTSCQDFAFDPTNRNNYLSMYEDRMAPISVHNGNYLMVQRSSNGNHMAN
jgi:hypothetical protein